MSVADLFSRFFKSNPDQKTSSSEELSRQIAERGDEVRLASEEKNRILAVFGSMTEGVVVLDAKKRILLVNTVLASVLGISGEGVSGRYYWEIFRDPVINEILEKALDERIGSKLEHSILLSERIFEVQISPVFAATEFLGAVAVFHDITRLKELERMRTEFVANVSHELKTPLTSILGFIETLKEGAIDDRENRLHFLEIIEDHSKKLNRLIDDLLRLSREESMKETPKAENTDLLPIVNRLVRGFGKVIDEKRIRIEIHIEPRPFFLWVEPLALEQAFSNLIENAIKYNETEGLLRIEARHDDESSMIRISDSGPGIPESELPRIFERFYRVDKSRTRDSGGTGLGLSIVKHIIERHGGTVTAVNINPKGTAFTVRLPGHSDGIIKV